MKNRFLTLAALCGLICIGCGGESKTKIPSDPTEAFPDPIFCEYVLDNFDTNGDGKISEDEALAVTGLIDVEFENIKSLEGIQYFTNLTELWCSGNQLTTLDVSKNTKLTDLECSNNKLRALDVSKNAKLEWLECGNNKLRALDVSKNTKLNWLSCSNNKIEELDLSKTNLGYRNPNSDCGLVASMETLKKVYLKKGWSIKGVTEDWNYSHWDIPDHTEIIFVD